MTTWTGKLDDLVQSRWDDFEKRNPSLLAQVIRQSTGNLSMDTDKYLWRAVLYEDGGQGEKPENLGARDTAVEARQLVEDRLSEDRLTPLPADAPICER